MAVEATTEPAIVQSRSDKREYKRVVLDNELQALLVSDPDTDKAAAAMDVYVGYFSDPDNLPGLAHFLEHMLFYSSAKYPVEDSYMKFLTEHGGHSNAYTSTEHTNFYFDVNADYLEEALDRFAQFFICPLMSVDATSREINAVDSENKKNLTVDAWRFNQLSKHNCHNGHSYSKFGTGNFDTLEVHPKSRGIDTREELLKFYERHYSSNLMCLVVYGKESLDYLQKLVEVKFSTIKNTNKTRSHFLGTPCHPEHVQILIKAVPIKEEHSLFISWPIPPEIRAYKEGPSQYVSHLLGHEADGSLFELLKSFGWATGLSAGETDQSLEYAFFTVAIELTDLGQKHVNDILGFLFQYIQLLSEQGVVQWIFDEVKLVRESNFNFKDKKAPFDYVPHLSSNMQKYPPEDWLVGSSLPCIFNAETILSVIKLLTPENARILWASKEFDKKTNDIEPWYGTAFLLERISEELVQQWKTAMIDARLHLPSPNPFVPSDFSLKPFDTKVDHPCLLRKSNYSNLWYKPDCIFKTAKACIKLRFYSPEINSSPEAVILSTLYVKLLTDYLNEYAYYAEVAGLNYSIYQVKSGFQVSISGYNHKMAALLEKIIEKIVNFEVKEDRFLIMKEKVLKGYLNFRFRQPYEQALYYISLLIEHMTWDFYAYLQVIPTLEAKDLTAFFPRMLSRLFFECYIAGNMMDTEAEALVLMIEKSLCEGPKCKVKPIFAAQHAEKRVVKLEHDTSSYYPIAGLNLLDANSAIESYFQIGQDHTVSNVLLELFILSAKQEVFYQLRTVQQLGYIVALANRDDFGVRGAQFIIQSPAKNPNDLDAKIEEFLQSFEIKLKELSNEDFQRNKNALIEVKLEKRKNLKEETEFFWGEIEDGTLKFSRQKDEVAELRKLTKQDLLDFFGTYMKLGAPKRAKLSIHVYGGLHGEDLATLEKGEPQTKQANGVMEVSGEPTYENGCSGKPARIQNIYEFRRSRALFGSLK